jgi:DNA-binding GntR family transcriptional regulator
MYLVDCPLRTVYNLHTDIKVSSMSAAPHPTIALLQTRSLTSVVQSELERMILSGELAPGDKLTEATLAARLGVSRGPLREA